jgi:hypothetical protein
VFEAEKAVRQKKYMIAVEKAAALLIAVVVVARLRRQSWR